MGLVSHVAHSCAGHTSQHACPSVIVGLGPRNPCSCMHETVHEDVAGEGAVH